jgi:cob(I)alamin adenosyltransferase
MSITTRRGDQGSTDMLFGHCVLKNHPRIHALGAVDELNAALGLVRVSAKTLVAKENVPRFQMELIALMGELATPKGQEGHYRETHPQHIGEDNVRRLDGLVEVMEREGALKFKGWALPGEGGELGAAHCDVARTVCRRAERSVMDLHGTADEVPNTEIIRYLNRLSDVLWLMARMEEKKAGE